MLALMDFGKDVLRSQFRQFLGPGGDPTALHVPRRDTQHTGQSHRLAFHGRQNPCLQIRLRPIDQNGHLKKRLEIPGKSLIQSQGGQQGFHLVQGTRSVFGKHQKRHRARNHFFPPDSRLALQIEHGDGVPVVPLGRRQRKRRAGITDDGIALNTLRPMQMPQRGIGRPAVEQTGRLRFLSTDRNAPFGLFRHVAPRDMQMSCHHQRQISGPSAALLQDLLIQAGQSAHAQITWPAIGHGRHPRRQFTVPPFQGDKQSLHIRAAVATRESAHQMDAPFAQQGGGQVDPGRTVMIAADHHDLQGRTTCHGVAEKTVEPFHGADGRIGDIIDIARDEEGVRLLVLQPVHQPVQEGIMLGAPLMSEQFVADMPVRRMHQTNEMSCHTCLPFRTSPDREAVLPFIWTMFYPPTGTFTQHRLPRARSPLLPQRAKNSGNERDGPTGNPCAGPRGQPPRSDPTTRLPSALHGGEKTFSQETDKAHMTAADDSTPVQSAVQPLALGTTTATEATPSVLVGLATLPTGGTPPYTYAVYRDTAPIATIGNLTPIATDVTFLPYADMPERDTACFYAVQASDSSTPPQTALAATSTAATVPSEPLTIGPLSATATASAVNLSLPAGLAGGSGVGYVLALHRSTEAGFSPDASTLLQDNVTFPFTDTTAVPGTDLYYAVVGSDDMDHNATSNIAHAKIPSPLAVGVLTASRDGTALQLALADGPSGGTGTGYVLDLYRDTTSPVPLETANLVAQNINFPYTDATVAPGTPVFYAATCTDSVGTVASTQTADSVSADYPALVLGDLLATPGADGIVLSLSAGLTGGTGSGYSFDIYRSTDPTFTPTADTLLTNVTALPFLDSSPLTGTDYAYLLIGRDNGGHSVTATPAGLGSVSAVQTLPTLARPAGAALNIVFIGDDITYGTDVAGSGSTAPPTLPGYCLDLLAAQPDLPCVSGANVAQTGLTTTDWLPTGAHYPATRQAMQALVAATPHGQQVFSILLGTFDAAVGSNNNGSTGNAQTVNGYITNYRAMIQQLLHDWPQCRVVLHACPFLSPNAATGQVSWDTAALALLMQFNAVLGKIAGFFAGSNPGQVMVGDSSAFAYFASRYTTELQPQSGGDGTMYLLPSADRGMLSLAALQAQAVSQALWNEGRRGYVFY